MCIFASKRLFSLHDTDSFVLMYTEPEIQVGDCILGTNFGDQPLNLSNVSGNTAVAIIRVSSLRGRHAGYGSGAPNTRTTPHRMPPGPPSAYTRGKSTKELKRPLWDLHYPLRWFNIFTTGFDRASKSRPANRRGAENERNDRAYLP